MKRAQCTLFALLLAAACSDSNGPGDVKTDVRFSIADVGPGPEQFVGDTGYWFHGPCCQNQRPVGIWFTAPDPANSNALFGPQFTFADTVFTNSTPVPGTYDFDSQFLHSQGQFGPVSAVLIFRGKQYLPDSGAIEITRAKTQELKGTFYLRMYDTSAPTEMIVFAGSYTVARDPQDGFGL